MEDKVIVEILIPGTDSSFDFQLPAQLRICDAVNEIIHVLETLQHNICFDHEHPVLCDMDRGYYFDPNAIIANARIKDGSKLMLL